MLGAHACIVPSACDKAMQVLLDADLPFEVHVAREEVPRGDGGEAQRCQHLQMLRSQMP